MRRVIDEGGGSMYQDYLNTENAQKIADRITKIMPCIFYITDTGGRILAGSTKAGTGSLHNGALMALKRKASYVAYEETPAGQGGISLPIVYEGRILGVMAISGDVKEVMPMGQICMSIALLMIENQILSRKSAITESRLREFLKEWVGRTEEPYDDLFYEQASLLGIDLKMPRTAAIITGGIRYGVVEKIKGMLCKGEYIVRQDQDEILILFRPDMDLETRIETIMDISRDLEQCYLGEADIMAGKTVACAFRTLNAAKALKVKKRILCHHEVALECILSRAEATSEVDEIIRLLKERDGDGVLRETIAAYVEDNDDYGQICAKLHIHRNTLNYRLAKIEELLNRNPRRARELMMLYIAVLKLEGGG